MTRFMSGLLTLLLAVFIILLGVWVVTVAGSLLPTYKNEVTPAASVPGTVNFLQWKPSAAPSIYPWYFYDEVLCDPLTDDQKLLLENRRVDECISALENTLYPASFTLPENFYDTFLMRIVSDMDDTSFYFLKDSRQGEYTQDAALDSSGNLIYWTAFLDHTLEADENSSPFMADIDEITNSASAGLFLKRMHSCLSEFGQTEAAALFYEVMSATDRSNYYYTTNEKNSLLYIMYGLSSGYQLTLFYDLEYQTFVGYSYS